MGPAVVSTIYLMLAVAAISLIATKAKIFKPLRLAIKARNAWLGELVSCPLCFSVWVTAAVAAIYRPVVMSSGFVPLDVAMAALAIVAGANVVMGVIAALFTYMPE